MNDTTASITQSTSSAPLLSGWQTAAPRDEIRPAFTCDLQGGPDGQGALIIEADRREGLDGSWIRAFPVIGGRPYRFRALYRARNVAVPRRSVVATIDWR